MRVAIVILHFLNQKLTEQCLTSVQKLKIKGLELMVIVVDNNPKEDLKNFRRKFKDYLFFKTKKNLGFTGGSNIGIKQALKNRADWVFLLNNDTEVGKDLLVQLIKAAKKDEKIGILGPKIYFAPGYEYHRQRYKPNERGKVFWYAGGLIDWSNVLASHRGVDEVDQGQYGLVEETDFVSGCGMLIKKEVFNQVGLLDNRYFAYLEDADFCQKAKKKGFKIVFVPKGKLWHFNASSSEVGGELHDYFLTRNRMLFGWRHAPLRARLALAKESIKILMTGRKWQKRGIKDFYLRKFGRGSWHEREN